MHNFTHEEKVKVAYIQGRYDELQRYIKEHDDISLLMRREQNELFQEFVDIQNDS